MTPPAPVPGLGPAPPGVQSVERALDVLETMAGSDALGISEVAAATGLPDGTAHRLLRTLVARGYARQGPDRRYSLGTRLLALGDGARRATVASSRPFLDRLVELSGETANLAVLEGDHAVYVAQVQSAHRLRMFAEVGRRVPVHSTAVGKVLLAGMADAAVTALVRRTGMAARTPRTLVSPASLLAELASVRKAGWARDDEEEEAGVRCLAVPVRDAGLVVAAMSVSGPAARVPAAPPGSLLAGMQAAAAGLTGAHLPP
jgi:IclR family transcriptional regulator, acetate operon repressor